MRGDLEFRGLPVRDLDPERTAKVAGQIHAQGLQAIPSLPVEFFKERRVPGELRRPRIVALEGPPVVPGPGEFVVHLHLGGGLGVAPLGLYRNREPHPTLGGPDPVPVLKIPLLVLDVVEPEEDVGRGYLMKIPQIGQILGLVGR